MNSDSLSIHKYDLRILYIKNNDHYNTQSGEKPANTRKENCLTEKDRHDCHSENLFNTTNKHDCSKGS